MLFGRRYRKSLWRHARELLWPTAGLKRAAIYIAHRVRRLPGTPSSIAVGFACGAAVSFTPFIGLHFVLAALLALALGGNVVASAIGTAVGNPWTFPLIWSAIYGFGRWLLGRPAASLLPRDMSLTWIFENPGEVLYPMVVGSMPISIAAWFIFFWPCYKAVQRYQAARQGRRQRAAARRRLRRRQNAYKTEGEGS